ncbi:AAA family ATPase [Candidatus Dojkabacteria bacterium]|uniref:AAA family ATPase n=1 Tax=Candidatus Dojkabacteria bacterium TaxID=2099670 RepID=A0A955I392_9BACT|nr:AAA family ATPase [Candidatus Dojkabacteria bacterium]
MDPLDQNPTSLGAVGVPDPSGISGMPPKVDDGNTSALKTTDALNPNPKINPSHDKEVIDEIEELQQKVDEVDLPEELQERAARSIQRLRRMAKRGSYTGEFETVEKYIYWITKIPWGKISKDDLDVTNAKRIMDQSHYGMNTVKNLVLDYLAVMQLQLKNNSNEQQNLASGDMAVLRGSSANAPVMIFVGLQGVGKTSIAKSIANAMGRQFQRVSIGAIGSVQALRGQSKAFLDAEPGGIVKALARAGTMNPVILLDEIEKASGNSGLLNDIMAALLEILDPEQNSTFIDHYIDFPIDLSKVFFICTANNLGTLSAALLDRMEVIRFTSYDDEEKIVIAKNYSMPKVLKNSGLSPDTLIIEEEVWPILVRPVGFDAGLRQLERNLATMVRAVARKIIEGVQPPIRITPENIRDFVLPDQGPLS